MNRLDTAKCLAIVSSAYGVHLSEADAEVWHLLLGDLDGDLVQTATKRLCLRDSAFPPRPGEIAAEVQRLDGTSPPGIEAAIGYYLGGQWDAHPIIASVAKRVYWDRVTAPDKARFQFRDLYEAAIHDHDDEPRRQFRELRDPTPIGELLEGS